MPDLSQLMTIAPSTAAFFMGQNQGQQRDTNAIAQQKAIDDLIQQQHDRGIVDQKLPFELDKLRLGNDQTSATTANLQRTGTKLDLDNDLARATQPGEIDATNTKNAMVTHQAIASHFHSLGDEVDDNPGVPPHIALAEAMKRRNLPQKAIDGITQTFANVPADQLSTVLKKTGDRVLRENPQYVQEMDKEGAAVQGRKDVANIEATSRQNVANTMATSRVTAAQARQKVFNLEEQIAKAPNARARYSLLNDAAEQALQANNHELYASLTARAQQQEAQAQAETAAANQKPGELQVPGMAQTPALSIRPPAKAASAPADSARISVISPDGKVGTLPASQIEEALKHGYKKAQ